MSSLVLEIESYELTAGEPCQIQRWATYFLLMEGTDVDITFYYKGSRIGGGVGFSGGDAVGPLSQPYDKVVMQSDTAQTVKTAVTSDPIRINRLAGVVTVAGVVETTTDYSRVRQGEAYIGGSSQGAVTGEYGYWQLWNPAGSGKDVIVNALNISVVSGQAVIRMTDVEGTAGNLNGYQDQSALNMLVQNPAQGSAASYIKKGSSANNTLLQSTAGISGLRLPNGYKEFRQPIVLEPGTGLAFRSDQTNDMMTISAEFFEVAR